MKIGFTEILVVLIVALIVVGPDKLPYYAKKLGEALSELRHVSSEATSEIRESVIEPLNEAGRPLKEALGSIDDIDKQLHANVNELKSAIEGIGKEEAGESTKKEPGAGRSAGDKEPEAGRSAGDKEPGAGETPAQDKEPGAGDGGNV